MNKIRAIIFLLTFLTITCLFSLRTEAALHPWYSPQNFHDRYNLVVEAYNRKKSNHSLAPKAAMLRRSDDEHNLFTSYFEGVLPGGQLSIITSADGKIQSVMVSKEIDGYRNVQGKKYPIEILKFAEVGMLILGALECPLKDPSSHPTVQEVFTKLVWNYDAEDIEYLYNPSLGITYALAFKESKGRLFLWISTPAK